MLTWKLQPFSFMDQFKTSFFNSLYTLQLCRPAAFGLYLIVLMVPHFSQAQSFNQDLQKKMILEVLSESEEWAKVHAAEYLLDLDEHRSEVKETFLKEKERYETRYPYRIGIWRVLARAATDPTDYETWVGKIGDAYRDPNGPDRQHAAETLAKLGVNLNNIDTAVVGADMAGDSTSLRTFVQWGALNGTYAYEPLLTLIEKGQEEEKRLAAYGLGKLPHLSGVEYRRLFAQYQKENKNSTAFSELATAAYNHCPNGAGKDRVKLDSSLHELIKRNDKNVLVRVMESYARNGQAKDLSFLLRFQDDLQKQKDHFSKSGYEDILATSAYAILKVKGRQERFILWSLVILIVLGLTGFWGWRELS